MLARTEKSIDREGYKDHTVSTKPVGLFADAMVMGDCVEESVGVNEGYPCLYADLTTEKRVSRNNTKSSLESYKDTTGTSPSHWPGR